MPKVPEWEEDTWQDSMRHLCFACDPYDHILPDRGVDDAY